MRNKPQELQLWFNRFYATHLPRLLRRSRLLSMHPLAVPVVTITVLLGLTGSILLILGQRNHLVPPQDAKIVIISHDNQQQIVPSKEPTVGELLDKLHLVLGEGDVVEPAATTVIDQDQFRVNIYRAVPVQIVDSGHKTFAFSAAKTPRAIALAAGNAPYPEDIITTEPADDFLRSGAIGEQVVINRATPVNVDLYGTPVVLRTHAATVGELMKEKKIKLEPKDQVSVPPTTPISANQSIAFIRTGSKVETVTEEITMPVQTINDASLAYGTNAVRQQGAPGQQIVTYQVELVNNVVTRRTVIQKVVTKAPVTQIAVVGSSLSGIKGDMALAGIPPGDYQYVDYIISRESGWCPTKWQGEPGACPPFHGTPGPGLGYGLGQATPGSKMSAYGADWATNPVTQLKWANGYAKGRFGTWAAAYAYWVSHHNW